MKKFLLLAIAVVFTVLMAAPSFAADTTFYGTYRVRAFAVENDLDFNDDSSSDDQDSWIDQRFRLMIESKQSDQLRGFVQFEIGDTDGPNRSHVWGGLTSPTADSNNSDLRVFVRQAYLSFNAGDVRLKIGRQVFGDAPDGGQSFRVADDKVYYGLYDGGLVLVSQLDALVATYKFDPVTFYLIYAKLDERGATSTYASRATSDADDDSDLYGIQAWYKQDTWDAAVYMLWNRDRNEGTSGFSDVGYERDPFWIGLGLGAKFDPVSIKAHAVWLTGNCDKCDASQNNYDYDSSAIDVDVSAKFGGLTVGVAGGIGSGDDNSSDRDYENFMAPAGAYGVQLGGRPAIFFDSGEVSNGGASLRSPSVTNGFNRATLGNITFAELYGSYKVSDALTFAGLIGNFWLTEDAGAADDVLGSELDLTVTYKLYPQLHVHGQAAWFFPDDGFYAQGATSKPDDTVSEYFARIQYDF